MSRSSCLFRDWKPLSFVFGVVLFGAVTERVPAATYTTPRTLNVGDIYELRRDGWVNNAPSGYDGDVLPKTDGNDGADRDNRYYQRHNVARAWPTDTGYWFTGSDQHEGEPDPAGEQWVDYMPPFDVLGSGRYSIEASYRWSASRASYPAVYRVYHALGTNEVLRDQRIGSPTLTIVYFSLGEFEMRPGSFVRVEDIGTESITFANMKFRLLAPMPRLQISSQSGTCQLRWATNAVGYRVESASALAESADWQQVIELPVEDGEFFAVTVFMDDTRRYFRLVKP